MHYETCDDCLRLKLSEPNPRWAMIATTARWPGSLQRMGVVFCLFMAWWHFRGAPLVLTERDDKLDGCQNQKGGSKPVKPLGEIDERDGVPLQLVGRNLSTLRQHHMKLGYVVHHPKRVSLV